MDLKDYVWTAMKGERFTDNTCALDTFDSQHIFIRKVVHTQKSDVESLNQVRNELASRKCKVKT